jgi:hypothetical protein
LIAVRGASRREGRLRERFGGGGIDVWTRSNRISGGCRGYTNVNTQELIVSELESTSEDLLSEVLEFVKSIKRQQPIQHFPVI